MPAAHVSERGLNVRPAIVGIVNVTSPPIGESGDFGMYEICVGLPPEVTTSGVMEVATSNSLLVSTITLMSTGFVYPSR